MANLAYHLANIPARDLGPTRFVDSLLERFAHELLLPYRPSLDSTIIR